MPHSVFFLVAVYCGERGLAHVELHDAVLDGNIEIVKGTLIRYVRKYPRKINEYDVRNDSEAILLMWLYGRT